MFSEQCSPNFIQLVKDTLEKESPEEIEKGVSDQNIYRPIIKDENIYRHMIKDKNICSLMIKDKRHEMIR